MKRLVFLLLISLFILVACGGGDEDDSDGGLEGVSDENTPTTSVDNTDSNDSGDTVDNNMASDSLVANIPDPQANIFEMPAVEGLPGQLIFVQGNTTSVLPSDGDAGRIFLANFDGSQPQMLATRVYTTSVSLSPDKSKIFYMAVEGRSWYAYLLDLNTLESTQLLHLQNQFGGVSGWSSDGTWLTVINPPPVGDGQYLVSADAATNLELGNGGILWLDNNQLIYTAMEGGGFNGPPTFVGVELVDPTTQERTPIELPISLDEIPTLTGTEYSQILAELGFTPISNFSVSAQNAGSTLLPGGESYLNVQAQTATASAPSTCDEFKVEEIMIGTEETTALYTVKDTLALTDLQVYGDGYLVERWSLNDCNFGLDNLNVSLEYFKANAEPQVLVEHLYPGTDVNLSFVRINSGAKYTLSPDERYIIWIDGSFGSLTTTLKIMDLATQETADLMTWTASSTNRFVIFDAFSSVLWVE